MPEPIIPEVQTPPVQPPIEGNPHLDSANATIAPGSETELDDALNAVFGDQKSNEKKTSETPKENKKQPEKSESKEDKKPIESKPTEQGELPTPESLDNDIPKKQQGWTALKNSYKQAHKIIEQEREENRKLKAGLAEKSSLSTKEIEALKTQVEELSKYRTMIDTESDPDFVSKYDQPINKIQTSIKELLGSLNVDKAVVDQIDFSNTKLMDQIIDHVGAHQDKITAKKLQRKVEEMIDLTEKRDETLSGHKTSYKDFIEGKKKESSMRGAEEEGRMLRQLQAQAEAQDEAGNPRVPFLRKMIAKDSATQPEIDQVNKHNRMVELMEQQVHKALKVSSPEEKTDLALAAVGSFWLKAQLTTAANKIKSLEEELKKISNVSSSSSSPRAKPSGNSGPKDLDLDSALSNHFAR